MTAIAYNAQDDGTGWVVRLQASRSEDGALLGLLPLCSLVERGRLALEVLAVGRTVHNQVWTGTRSLALLVSSALARGYPGTEVEIDRAPVSGPWMLGAELRPRLSAVVPLVDERLLDAPPLATVDSLLMALSDLQDGETALFQMVLASCDARPWQAYGRRLGRAIAEGTAGVEPALPGSMLGQVFGKPGEQARAATQLERSLISAIERKLANPVKVGACLRFVCRADGGARTRALFERVTAAVTAVEPRGFNRLTAAATEPADAFLSAVASRTPSMLELMTPAELGAIWGPPSRRRGLAASLWTRPARFAPEEPLPKVGTVLGESLSGDPVCLALDDRRHHVFIVGRTGMGKTTMLLSAIKGDLEEGRGLAVIDPKGGLVDRVLRQIPRRRLDDVVLLDVADVERPMSLNLLAAGADRDPYLLVSGLVSIFRRMYAESWGPRLERLLRYGLLALCRQPGATLADLPLFLRDVRFRRHILARTREDQVSSFWRLEFDQWSPSQQAAAVEPVLNKVGALLVNPRVHAMIAQPTGLDLRRMMDEGRILLANLAEGQVGEDGSQLLGASLAGLIQLAAAGRAGVPEESLRDFSLYVDEFQRFATTSFVRMLSEARAFRLNLVLATQFLRQVPEEVRSAALGNVGTLIAFRVGEDDAPLLMRRMGPPVRDWDLLNQDAYQALVKTSLHGRTMGAFTVITKQIPTGAAEIAAEARARSRTRYGGNAQPPTDTSANGHRTSSPVDQLLDEQRHPRDERVRADAYED